MMNKYFMKCKWIRNKDNKKVGYLLAYTDYQEDYEKVKIGFSFCDTRYDKFDKYIAEQIADERAYYLGNAFNLDKIIAKVPYEYRQEFYNFISACTRYFKDKEFPAWVDTLELNDFDYE